MISALILTACLSSGCASPFTQEEFDDVNRAGKCRQIAAFSQKYNSNVLSQKTYRFIRGIENSDPIYTEMLWAQLGEGVGFVKGIHNANKHFSISDMEFVLSAAWKEVDCEVLNE